MQLRIRNSSKKRRKKNGFLTRKKSPGARKYLKARRTGKKQKGKPGVYT